MWDERSSICLHSALSSPSLALHLRGNSTRRDSESSYIVRVVAGPSHVSIAARPIDRSGVPTPLPPQGRRRCNPQGYLLSRCSTHARHIKQREEHEMFIFHDVVDLFALLGLLQVAKLVVKRRHKVS